jgi:hypothetical protein
MTVSDHLQHIAVLLAEDCFMPTLEKMSHIPVSLGPVPHVTEEKSVQEGGQWGWTDVDQVVDVSAHQNIGIQAKVIPQSGFLKQLQISPPVGVIRKIGWP